MNWYKKAIEEEHGRTRWFKWNDNNGNVWNIIYRDIEPSEIYENGKALSNKAIMEKMIIGIQNEASDEKLPDNMIKYWINKVGLNTTEFFDEVEQTNNLFMDEKRIEQRDIDMGLI